MPKSNKRIGIAMPHASRSIEYPGTQHNLRIAIDYAKSRGYDILISDPASASVAANRNIAANNLLKEGADWIFTCDDDMFYPQDVLIRLIENNKDIISGLYVGRSIPYPIMAFQPYKKLYKTIRHTDFTIGDILEVVGVGGGCVLIKKGVFEKIPAPWYSMPPIIWMRVLTWLHKQLDLGLTTRELPRELLPDLKDIRPDAWDGGVAGEDIYFCLLAGEFGYKIYLDTGVQCAHVGDYKHTLADNVAYEKIMEVNSERTGHTEASPATAENPSTRS